MQKIFLLFIVTFSINLFSYDKTLLKSQKQEILQHKAKEIKARAKQLKYNWLSPLNLSASVSKSDSQDDIGYDSSIRLNQDLFRSGGIGHALDYADLKLAFDLIVLDKERAVLYKELFIAVLEYQRLNLQLKQTQLRVENSKIELFLKKEQYKAGTVDITLLNRALMDRNSILKTLLSTKTAILSIKIKISKLTDKPLGDIDIPKFEQLSKKLYLNNNLNILKVKLENSLAKKTYKLTKSKYLPRLSLSGQYGYRDNETDNFQYFNQDNNYHNIALNLNMPLDYNSKASKQEKKIAILRTKLEISDLQTEEFSFYKTTMSQIKNYQEHSQIIEENIALYDNLIEISKKGFASGYKSGYDVKTLKNTKKIDILEKKINDIHIQTELTKLHFSTNLGSDYER